MRIGALVACALIALVAQPGTAHARDQFGPRDAVTVDPSRAYIFFRTRQRMNLQFLREPSEQELAAWEAARTAAFARDRERYPRRLAAWQREEESCRRNPSNSCRNRPERPGDYTLETFPFAPPELDNFLEVSGGRRFTSAEGEYTYLVAVEPGTYALYGQIDRTQNGNIGTCLCMGSLRFEARAGQIVDVGEIHPRLIVPPGPQMPRPDRLQGLPVYPAELRAADKIPNYFGVLIDRIAPLAGVLAYERDRVIDLRLHPRTGLLRVTEQAVLEAESSPTSPDDR